MMFGGNQAVPDTALHPFDVLTELINSGKVDRNLLHSRDGFGKTICHLLVSRLKSFDTLNEERVLKLFSSIPLFDWLSVDCRGDTVLHTACSESGEESESFLLAVLAKDPRAAAVRNVYGQTPAMVLAARKGLTQNPIGLRFDMASLAPVHSGDMVNRLGTMPTFGGNAGSSESFYMPPWRMHAHLQTPQLVVSWLHPSASPDDWRSRQQSGGGMFGGVESVRAEAFYRIILMLISDAGTTTDLFEPDLSGNSLLHYVAASRYADDLSDEVASSFQAAAGFDVALLSHNNAGFTPQHCLIFSWASKSTGFSAFGHFAMTGSNRREYQQGKRKQPVMKLLFSKPSCFLVACKPSGETLLHLLLSMFVSASWSELFEDVVSACLNVADANGVYPIHLCFANEPGINQTPVFTLLRLLQLGADPFVAEKSGSKMTIFHMAAANGKQQTLLRFVSLGLIRADNVKQWCTQDAHGKTPLHYLAITSLQRAICSSFSSQLEVLGILSKLAGEEGCSIKDKTGRTFLDFVKVSLPASVASIPMVPLPADACRHAYVAFTEDWLSIRTVWSRFSPPTVCDACKRDLFEDGGDGEVLYGLETCSPMHAACLKSSKVNRLASARLFVDSSFSSICCFACEKKVPSDWSAKLLPQKEELAASLNANPDGSEWDLLQAGREVGVSVWRNASQVETVLDGLHCQVFMSRLRSINLNPNSDKPFILPVSRLPSANANNGFNFGNNAQPVVPPRSAAGKKYNRSKLKVRKKGRVF
jgi:hypothetical protein